MKNNRIIQYAIYENCNADDATNKNHNRSSNEHLYYKGNDTNMFLNSQVKLI